VWNDNLGAWFSLFVLLALFVLAVAMRWRRPLVFWLAAFLGLGAAAHLEPVDQDRERHGRPLSLPSLGRIRDRRGGPGVALPDAAPGVGRAGIGPAFYTGRTWARNADWHDNLTLGLADVATEPRSVRLHDMLAKAWFDRDPRANLDRAIAEQEKAWKLMRPLAPEQSSELIPARLGIYYAEKADLAPEAERQAWREKSIAILLEARKISLAAEQIFDDAQLWHDKPLAPRQAFLPLYLYLADDYLNLGRFREALDTLRYARILSPRLPAVYEAMAVAYRMGSATRTEKPWRGRPGARRRTRAAPALYCAAVTELEQAMRDHRTPNASFELEILARCGEAK
jgi:tetratricopeptide (TPR) repeat protein